MGKMKAIVVGAFALVGISGLAALTADQDYLTAVRPVGVNGQEEWNRRSLLFLYAPTFVFTNRADAASYRFTVTDSKGTPHSFSAKSARDSLAPVWSSLPTGWTRVVCEALDKDGRILGIVGVREFGRKAPFREGTYPKPARSAAATSALIMKYVMRLPIIEANYLAEKPVPAEMVRPDNQVFISYPSKMGAAMMSAMAKLAQADPSVREAALRLAEGVKRKLFSITEPEGVPLAGLPRTYEEHPALTGHPAKMVRANGGKIMMIYPCAVANAYLSLYEVTKDESLRVAAVRIADKYLALQGRDGTWPLNCRLKDGLAVESNRLMPLHMMKLLERLYALTDELKYRQAADAAFAYVERGPLTTWNWEGQFEDVPPAAKFENLTKHDACDTALYLLGRFSGDERRLAQARELLRFAEDQFVCWENPLFAGQKFVAAKFGVWEQEVWRCPGVLEQYNCYVPIDASAAKLIRTYLALYDAAHEPLDLAKARTLGDSIIRETDDNGHLPTFWLKFSEDWPNCMIASAAALTELAGH